MTMRQSERRVLLSRLWVALFAVVLGLGMAPASARDPAPVSGFELERYLGRWYEVARLPNRFQRKCAGSVTADYGKREDGLVSVTNRCVTSDGSRLVALGVAKPVAPEIAALKVSFLPNWLRWLPFTKADYRVLELAPDYSYALVGTPDRDYLWVLSRSPQLPAATLTGLIERAAEMGYPTDQLILTQQPTTAAAFNGW